MIQKVRDRKMIELKALRVPSLTEEVAINLKMLLNDLPGVEHFVVALETQEVHVIFDEHRLSVQSLAQEMARVGCPLRNINALLFLNHPSLGRDRLQQALVKEWMTRDVVTINPDKTLPEAYRQMTDKKIRRLPVVDKDRLVGLVTLDDVHEAEALGETSPSIWEGNYQLWQLTVDKIMMHNPVTISLEETVGKAAQVMLEHNISGLPVVDSRQDIVGIITESDIFRMVVQNWRKGPPTEDYV
jgi:acetoin utilization protein AcuB